MEDGFEVTPEWLHRYSTSGTCGWTAGQLRIVGVSWPPPRKWLKKMRGRVITQEARQAFETSGLARRRQLGLKVQETLTGAQACRIWEKYGT